MFFFVFPECVAKGSRLTLGVWGIEPCSRPVVSAFPTVRNRPQASASIRNRTQPWSDTVSTKGLRPSTTLPTQKMRWQLSYRLLLTRPWQKWAGATLATQKGIEFKFFFGLLRPPI